MTVDIAEGCGQVTERHQLCDAIHVLGVNPNLSVRVRRNVGGRADDRFRH